VIHVDGVKETAVKRVCKGLVDYLGSRPSFRSARRHYKLEEWAAVEAFHYFDAELRGWHASPGTLPYVSAHQKGRDKWCDVYARKVRRGRAEIHAWIEFKALPFSAAPGTQALRGFAADLRVLAGMRRRETIRYWVTRTHPATGKSERSWFDKFDAPGSIEEGDFVGIAILLVALHAGRSLDDVTAALSGAVNSTSSTLIVREENMGGPGGTGGSLACLVYRVPIGRA